MCLVAIPLLIAVGLIFFMIASIDGALFGTPEDELNGIIDNKVKQMMDSVREDNGGQVGMRLGDNFESIQVALKMIPNLDQHDFLLKRMALVGGNETQYTGRESDVDYDEKSMGEEDDYQHFFEWTGANSDDFPKLRFDEEHVPLGNSVNYCLGLSWTTLKKRN